MSKILSFITRITKICIRNPNDVRHIFGMANAAAEQIENPDADVRIFPLINYSSIAENRCRFSFQMFPGVEASITLIEAAALAALIKKSNAKRIFEFGTYK